MGDQEPSFVALCATKGSLINLNYGDSDNPYTGRLATLVPGSKAPYSEDGIYKSAPNLFYNQPTTEYRFSILAAFITINPSSRNLMKK